MFVETDKRPQGEPIRENDLLKLSGAIREGCKLRPQGFGNEWTDGKSCAMGAAAEARGIPYGRFVSVGWAASMWPSVPRDLIYEVAKMNDGGMTREAIADWLEAQGL